MKITFKEFDARNSLIPDEFTCKGRNINPGIIINDIDKSTRSLSILTEDLDSNPAGFLHWIAWNVEPISYVAKNLRDSQMIVGKNDFGDYGYSGPCPHVGEHRYQFCIYALSSKIHLSKNVDKEKLLLTIKPITIANAKIIAKYKIN